MECGPLETAGAVGRDRSAGRSKQIRSSSSLRFAAQSGFLPALSPWARFHLAAARRGRSDYWSVSGDFTSPLMRVRLVSFRKKNDPISDRARDLNDEIAQLEHQIKKLDERLQRDQERPRLRSTALPHGGTTLNHPPPEAPPVPVPAPKIDEPI